MKQFQRSGRLAVAAAALALLVSDAAARIYPAWSPASNYILAADPGFLSLAGQFEFQLGGGPTSASIHYADDGGITASGFASSLTIYTMVGTYAVDPVTKVQHVHLADPAKVSLFTFDGDLSPSGADIVGTFSRKSGYLDYPGDEAGALTLHRVGDAAESSFTLTMATRMDDKGKIRGRVGTDGKTDTLAMLELYDGRVVTEGKISGKVKTDRNAITTGSIKIRGKKWSVDLAGPIDASGFHALANVNASGFVVTGIPLTLLVQPGPTPPDGKPPKPPANLLPNATATIVNNQVTLTHSSVPSKFFGKSAGLSVQFPLADGIASVSADVSTASTATPRRFVVTMGAATYGSATAPVGNGVTLNIKKLSTVRDGIIEVLCTGQIFNGSKVKQVNVLVQAVVQ